MTETWILKTSDGEVYNLQVAPTDDPTCYDGIYNLMEGVTGHHGMPVTLTSDTVPNIAGAELRQVQYGIRTVYLPLFIRGNSAAEFHHNFAKLRQSLDPNQDTQLWVTNEEGETRVLYCRYSKGFDNATDDSASKGLSWTFLPLYMDALDPFWYDPPGAEISNNYSSDPWSTDFLTFTVPVGIAADGMTGDTTLTLDSTDNLVAGMPLELHAGQTIVSDTPYITESLEEEKVGDSMQYESSVSVSTETSTVQVNQAYHVSGTVVSQNQNLSSSVVTITETDPNGVTTTHTAVTNNSGNYVQTIVSDINGVYTYQVNYNGDATHLPSTAVTSITVGTVVATTLTLTSSNANPAPGASFNLTGTLATTGGGVASQPINIYKKTATANVLVGSAHTNSSGVYSFPRKETTSGYCHYSATYAGDAISTTSAKQDPGIMGWLEWLFEKIFGLLEGLFKAGRYSASNASLVLKIGSPTYSIEYQAALPPSMINDGEIQYFAAHGFNGIICIAEKIGDPYSIEKGVITGQGLWAAIDISVVTNSAASIQTGAIATWLASLYAAGWRTFAGFNTTGRSGDPAYIASLGAGARYINYSSTPRKGTTTNPDIDGTGVYQNTFQFCNPNAIPSIEAWTQAAFIASPSVKSGLMAQVLPNDANGINQILANAVKDDCPDYTCILDWSEGNATGMTHFCIWFQPKYNAVTARDIENEQVVLYKSLGFEQIVTEMKKYYPATVSTWSPPTLKATELTVTHVDGVELVTFSGQLTTITDGAALVGKTITLQELPQSSISGATTFATASTSSKNITVATGTGATFVSGHAQAVTISDANNTETNSITSISGDVITLTNYPSHTYTNGTITAVSYPSGQPTIGVTCAASFVAGDVVTVSDNTPYSESRTVSTVNYTVNTITFTTNLTNTYTIAKSASVLGTWTDRAATATTDANGKYSIPYDPTPAGKHVFRLKYAGDGTHMAVYAPTLGITIYADVLLNDESVMQLTSIVSVDSPTVITIADALTNDYLVSADAYAVEIDPNDCFLTNTTSLDEALTADAVQGAYTVKLTDTTGCIAGHPVTLLNNPASPRLPGTTVTETNVIASVDSQTQLTLVNALANTYAVTDNAEIVDTFAIVPRALNPDCELVIFWMRGCPPCYTAKKQLLAIKAAMNPTDDPTGLQVTFVEIQDHVGQVDELGNLNVGMDQAAILYPDAYNFAANCGPPPPASYGVINSEKGMMPAVISVYRSGLWIKSWCGVHTTGVDPIASDVIEDTCGPATAWRLGTSSIGFQVVIPSGGEAISYPVWTITGPGQTPTFTNVTTGDVFQLNHELVAGETVIVDATEESHTVGSTASADFVGSGYMKTETCPTCHGTGVVAACATCGGQEICPTCHGTGIISVWVASSTGSTNDVGSMYNLRFQMDPNGNTFWGFAPTATVIQVEMGLVQYGSSIINMQLVKRYAGI
jgi:hypothetical protein